ncbi:TraR/DksA family transcriptional regulator [Streptomyces sp. NPDC003717]|uniref:TraR/DksA family transcriptional regulator n=1 Tax=Streptomyces sp. NPDC003717 TaxID=3154276 RepID=UPI0033A828A4
MVAKKGTTRKSAAEQTTAAKRTTATKKSGAAKKATAAKKTAATKKTTAAQKTTAAKKVSAATKGAAAKKGSAAAPKAAKTAKAAARTAGGEKKAGAARAAEETGATTVVAKKNPGTATAAKSAVPKARGTADPGDLAVRPGEDPWSPQEVEEARADLQAESDRLRAEITASERSLQGLMRDSADGAGDDEADTGTKNVTREHELALAANAREMLLQTDRALERLDAGTYGLCENCANPIGKARMQAFPRATLCVECKQKQERRY